MVRSPLTEYHPWQPALLAGIGYFGTATLSAATVAFGVMAPRGWETVTFVGRLSGALQISCGVVRNMAVDFVNFVDPVFFVSAWLNGHRGYDWLGLLAQDQFEVDFYGRVTVSIVSGLLVALPMALRAWLHTPLRQGAHHVSGPRLVKGITAPYRARAAIRQLRSSPTEIELAPGVPLPREREIRSLFVLGAQRSGKTNFLCYILRQLVQKNTKLVIHDTKGDMTANWPTGRFVLLAPHDARSWAWDIGRDVLNEKDAFEFAVALVPSGNDPTWAQGAQVILSALIIALQTCYGTRWGWRELSEVLELPPTAMRSLALRHQPIAANFLVIDENGEFTRNAVSYVNTLIAPTIRLVKPLASAWGDLYPKYRLSLTEWVSDDYQGCRQLILQRSPQYPEMSALWLSAAIRHMVAVTGGANFPDNPTRRIWFVLDEFPQLGKISNLFSVPATHAAKGIILALTAQTLGQVTDIYGSEAVDHLASLTGTKVVFRVQPGPTAAAVVQKFVGQWRFQVPELVQRPGSDGKLASVTEYRDRQEDLLLPTALSDLGPGATGVTGFVLGLGGGDVYRLQWPYENWPEQRPPSVLPGQVAPYKSCIPDPTGQLAQSIIRAFLTSILSILFNLFLIRKLDRLASKKLGAKGA